MIIGTLSLPVFCVARPLPLIKFSFHEVEAVFTLGGEHPFSDKVCNGQTGSLVNARAAFAASPRPSS